MNNRSKMILIGSLSLLGVAILITVIAATVLILQQREANAAIALKKKEYFTTYQGIYNQLTTADTATAAGVEKFITAAAQAQPAGESLTQIPEDNDTELLSTSYKNISESAAQLKDYQTYKNCVESFKPKYNKSYKAVNKYYVSYAVAQGDGNYSAVISDLNILIKNIDAHNKMLANFKGCFEKEVEYSKYFDQEVASLTNYKSKFVVPLIKVLRTGSQVKIQTFLNKGSTSAFVYVDGLYTKGKFQETIDNLLSKFKSTMDDLNNNNEKISTAFNS